LFVGGVVVAQQTAIVALGITRDGRKEPLGLSLGSTENAVVCTDLLQDLLARGLAVDGRMLVHVRRCRRAHEFLDLLKAIRRRWPHGRLVIILDNLSIHTTPVVRAWLTAQAGRIRCEFLPLPASWLDQIEIWFSILERQALRRASDALYQERALCVRMRETVPPPEITDEGETGRCHGRRE
jgi:hypothetical protein